MDIRYKHEGKIFIVQLRKMASNPRRCPIKIRSLRAELTECCERNNLNKHASDRYLAFQNDITTHVIFRLTIIYWGSFHTALVVDTSESKSVGSSKKSKIISSFFASI